MVIHGDFYGFSFRGKHSSDFNILRVSNGSRYDEDLIPTFKDQTLYVPGADETFYFNSHYQQRTFNIKVAFNKLTEKNFRELRQWLNGTDIGPLVFDECPYKAYSVKVQSAPKWQTICFDEVVDGVKQRIYKGEGTINFIAYYPFARSIEKWLDNYTSWDNKEEWKDASGLLDSSSARPTNLPNIDTTPSTQVIVYNPGDLEANWIAKYSFDDSDDSTPTALCSLATISLFSYPSASALYTMRFNAPIQAKSSLDAFIGINSKTHLIEGYDSNHGKTGTLYNDYLIEGDFFTIPISTTTSSIYQFMSYESDSTPFECSSLEYDYLYY